MLNIPDELRQHGDGIVSEPPRIEERRVLQAALDDCVEEKRYGEGRSLGGPTYGGDLDVRARPLLSSHPDNNAEELVLCWENWAKALGKAVQEDRELPAPPTPHNLAGNVPPQLARVIEAANYAARQLARGIASERSWLEDLAVSWERWAQAVARAVQEDTELPSPPMPPRHHGLMPAQLLRVGEAAGFAAAHLAKTVATVKHSCEELASCWEEWAHATAKAVHDETELPRPPSPPRSLVCGLPPQLARVAEAASFAAAHLAKGVVSGRASQDVAESLEAKLSRTRKQAESLQEDVDNMDARDSRHSREQPQAAMRGRLGTLDFRDQMASGIFGSSEPRDMDIRVNKIRPNEELRVRFDELRQVDQLQESSHALAQKLAGDYTGRVLPTPQHIALLQESHQEIQRLRGELELSEKVRREMMGDMRIFKAAEKPPTLPRRESTRGDRSSMQDIADPEPGVAEVLRLLSVHGTDRSVRSGAASALKKLGGRALHGVPAGSAVHDYIVQRARHLISEGQLWPRALESLEEGYYPEPDEEQAHDGEDGFMNSMDMNRDGFILRREFDRSFDSGFASSGNSLTQCDRGEFGRALDAHIVSPGFGHAEDRREPTTFAGAVEKFDDEVEGLYGVMEAHAHHGHYRR